MPSGARCGLSIAVTVFVLVSVVPAIAGAGASSSTLTQSHHDHEPGHGHGSGTGDCVSEYRARRGTGRACETDRGTYKVRLRNGIELETHGPDDASDIVAAPSTKGSGGGKGKPSPSPSPTPTESPSPSPTTTAPLCAPAGTDRSQLIYAVASDDVDQYRDAVSTIRARFFNANELLSSAAAKLGSEMSYRVSCDPQGQPDVARAVLAIRHSEATFESIANALVEQGYSDPYTDYWVFYDEYMANGVGGEASLCRDDRLVIDNCSNARVPSYAMGYGYWWTTNIVMMHENGHNMGAVQLSAPNSSGAGHCNDSYDIMCYDDGGPTAEQRYICSGGHQWDCGSDDYFHPSAPEGSYLASHWNLASCLNLKLNKPSCPPPTEEPPPPSPSPSPSPSPDADTVPPTVDAGDDVSCLRIETCSTEPGQLRDDRGLIAYEWVYISCSRALSITAGDPCPNDEFSPISGKSYTVRPKSFGPSLVEATWTLELRAWDTSGNSGSDRVTVTLR